MLEAMVSGLQLVMNWQFIGLVLLATLLGNFFGAVPGLGGDAATWICYGHAVQTSKSNENFGKGDIRGVIGVERRPITPKRARCIAADSCLPYPLKHIGGHWSLTLTIINHKHKGGFKWKLEKEMVQIG